MHAVIKLALFVLLGFFALPFSTCVEADFFDDDSFREKGKGDDWDKDIPNGNTSHSDRTVHWNNLEPKTSPVSNRRPNKLVQAVESNTDRPGSDYRSFWLDQQYRGCEVACENESRCKSWAYVKPGVQGRRAKCWLKDRVPSPVISRCCISGVKHTHNKRITNKRAGDDCWCEGGGVSIGRYSSKANCKADFEFWWDEKAFYNEKNGMCTSCQSKNVRCRGKTNKQGGNTDTTSQRNCKIPPSTYARVRGYKYKITTFGGYGGEPCLTDGQADARRAKGQTVHAPAKRCWACPVDNAIMVNSSDGSSYCARCPSGKKYRRGCCH